MSGNGSMRIENAAVKNVVVRIVEGSAQPKEFALSQNYPNPFNPTTRLTVEMPKTAILDVSVFDVLGRKINTLLQGEQSAGYHTVEWNGTDAQGLAVPTGMYFVRMTSEEFNTVRKIMLLK